MPSLPVSKEKALLQPPVAAALGMALSFYTLPIFLSSGSGPFLVGAFLFALVTTVCCLRVMNSLPMKNLLYKKIDILMLALTCGFSLGIASRASVKEGITVGIPTENVIALTGILLEDPRSLHSGSGMGTLDLIQCAGEGGIRASAGGRVTVFFLPESIPRLREFGRGCEIFAEGLLAQSERGPLFRASSVHIVKPAPALEQVRTGLRTNLLEKFQGQKGMAYMEGDTPIWGAFASALLLGVRDDLDVDFSGAFRNSGCSYILALSGMHLAILSSILAFFLKRPLGIRWASLIGAIFIVAYVFVAGSQPSLVRAAIMYLLGSISVWGLVKGRPLSLLSMAFIIQLILQSETGITVSFILSYLALGGILTLGQTLQELFQGRLPRILKEGLSASLGAFIVTAPVVVFYFGTLRPIGVIAGLFLAPISSIFMILALAALGAAYLPLPLFALLDVILSWLYRIIDFFVSLAGRVPGLSSGNPLPALICTLLLWLLLLLLQKRDHSKRSGIASFDSRTA